MMGLYAKEGDYLKCDGCGKLFAQFKQNIYEGDRMDSGQLISLQGGYDLFSCGKCNGRAHYHVYHEYSPLDDGEEI